MKPYIQKLIKHLQSCDGLKISEDIGLKMQPKGYARWFYNCKIGISGKTPYERWKEGEWND